jgi:hypothetical protein
MIVDINIGVLAYLTQLTHTSNLRKKVTII